MNPPVATTSPTTGPPTRIGDPRLIHPWDVPLFVISAIFSVGIAATAVLLALKGANWLQEFPQLHAYAGEIRAAAIAAVLAPITVALLRNVRQASARGNSVRLSRPEQAPRLLAIMERYCERLGVPMPEVYVAENDVTGLADTRSTWGKKHFIVLGTGALQPELSEVEDVVEFILARELAKIHLGHTQWLNELVLSYVLKVPVLMRPLHKARTYTLDRHGAFLAPRGVRGLMVLAVGRRMLRNVSVGEFVRQAMHRGGYWERLADAGQDDPLVVRRVRALYDLKLFDEASDLRRTT